MEKTQGNYLTNQSKRVAILLASVCAIVVACFFNKNFFQYGMKGRWHVIVPNEGAYYFDNDISEVVVTSNSVEIDNATTININFSTKSKYSTIFRESDDGNLSYYFYDKNDNTQEYQFIYDRKKPNELLFIKLGAQWFNESKMYMLERSDK